MRLASPLVVIFFQTIFNMSHLLTLAFSAKNISNEKKFSSFLGGRVGGTHQLELQQRKSETCDIAKANSSNIALKLRPVVKSATKIASSHCHKNEFLRIRTGVNGESTLAAISNVLLESVFLHREGKFI